jgi:hypothetical protein
MFSPGMADASLTRPVLTGGRRKRRATTRESLAEL